MVKLTLYWTKSALVQRNHIFNYWNNRNKSNRYSKRLLKVINESTSLILSFPEMGRKTEIGNHRRIPLEHYSLFYRKVDDKIIVTVFGIIIKIQKNYWMF